MLHWITLGAMIAALAIAAGPALADPPNGLPPGLQKKVERGGELPPGWEKKLVVGDYLDDDIYYHRRIVIPASDVGIATVEIGGRLLRIYEDTRRIVEILD